MKCLLRGLRLQLQIHIIASCNENKEGVLSLIITQYSHTKGFNFFPRTFEYS